MNQIVSRVEWIVKSLFLCQSMRVHKSTTAHAYDASDTGAGCAAPCLQSEECARIQVHLKIKMYNEKGQYFLSLISESETHILYRFIRWSEIFQAFNSWNLDDYGLQIMKTHNSVSQKIGILHKINTKGYFKPKCQTSEKYVHFYALNTWLSLFLHELLHQCSVAWR